MRFVSPVMVVGYVPPEDQWLSFEHLFFLTFLFPLSSIEKCVARCQKTKIVIYLLNQIKFSFF
jgi:hypothetical protein